MVFAAAVVVFALFASSAQQREKHVRLETELITLQPSGFEPNEIRRPQGTFVLGVDNRAGVESIELQFMRVDGQRLNALQTPKRKFPVAKWLICLRESTCSRWRIIRNGPATLRLEVRFYKEYGSIRL